MDYDERDESPMGPFETLNFIYILLYALHMYHRCILFYPSNSFDVEMSTEV